MADEEPTSIWMVPERQERSGPGRRPGYSREQITRAAVRIADAEGVEAATMRRVAGELGTGAMSLYRYVPRRDDLFDLMIDLAMSEIELPGGPSGDWRSDLALLAGRTRATGLRHPWLITLLTSRPTLGPQLLRVHEFALGALDATGLGIDDITGLVGMLDDYTHSAVRRELGWLDEARRTGLDPERWKRDYMGPYVRQVVESGDFPLFNRSILDSRTAHLTPEERFRHGLDRVLDAIAALIPSLLRKRSSPPAQPEPTGTKPDPAR
ncbi:TetR/AcrR family transcriptional regulator [Nonomuraea rubra]|uniref:AcrR family transcriptional regulator n=1 Tax=Nonomuraea rubra TaxID=46180 RepID=A0A7X0NLP9_9ACTN|nr:TetR/AcrR family transcriptional regulator [Nonomuraea rubra]MBB6545718.1 AcrR family transcriptional regulator [Nonomuraea rubra]